MENWLMWCLNLIVVFKPKKGIEMVFKPRDNKMVVFEPEGNKSDRCGV